MSLWRQFIRGLHTLLNRQAKDQEIVDEVESYLDHATADFVARGLSPR